MDYMQLIGALSIASFFIVFFLGMVWKRVSATAAFYGIIAGLVACSIEYILYRVGVLRFKHLWHRTCGHRCGLLQGGTTVTILTTLLTKSSDPIHLKGLTYSHSARLKSEGPWYTTP
jgi:SSS family solute:Na+ symporter